MDFFASDRPDQNKVDAEATVQADALQVLGPIKAWSFSTLTKFEECPYRVYLNKVEKIPEPSGSAADRGTAIHTLAEDYVQGHIGELPDELSKYTESFKQLRKDYEDGKVEVEGDWAFSQSWEPTGWAVPNTWARIKLDAFVTEDETSGRAIDYKTGKKWNNELKHGTQLMTYAIASFMRFPKLQYCETELWYLDQNHGPTIQAYTREQALMFWPKLNKRALTMTSCTDFEPKPSRQNCKWCHYAKDGSCEWGVID